MEELGDLVFFNGYPSGVLLYPEGEPGLVVLPGPPYGSTPSTLTGLVLSVLRKDPLGSGRSLPTVRPVGSVTGDPYRYPNFDRSSSAVVTASGRWNESVNNVNFIIASTPEKYSQC